MTPHQEQELLDRARRIETRLTKYMESAGFDTKVQRAEWVNGTILIPSAGTSIKEIMEVVPFTWDRTKPVKVMHHEKFIGLVMLP